MNHASLLIRGTFILVLHFFVANTANVVSGQVIWDRDQIDRVRAGEFSADEKVEFALKNLRAAADLALKNEPYSVTHKNITPPSGDLHDYLSYSRYWWPDPDKPDGLPYIRKDGVVNRKLIEKGDRSRLGDFCSDVQDLGLAGYLFKEPKYTAHAAKLVRTWFVEEGTRMNPNLNFGQGVPGREAGRGPGIIDTRAFMLVLDAVELFDEENWSADDQKKLQSWFDKFQQWLKDSPLGQHEHRATNNHGSWFAAQRARYALFAGKEDVAKEMIEETRKRIADQFDADGNQAAELKRTLSLRYSLFNITALSRVARVGDSIGENLWEFTPEHGCGMEKGLKVLLPYLVDQSKWEHEQLDVFAMSASFRLTFYLYSEHFDDDVYLDTANKVEKVKHPERDFTVLIAGKKAKEPAATK